MTKRGAKKKTEKKPSGTSEKGKSWKSATK